MRAPLKFELDRRQGVLNIGYGAGSSPTFTNLTVTGVALFADGTAAAPSISFANSTNMGFFRSSANVTALSIGGVAQFFWGNYAMQGAGAGSYISLPTTGAISLVAAGTAQNITFTPSTSGGVYVANTGANTPRLYIQTTSQPTANGVLAFMGSAGTALLTFGTGQNIPGNQAFEWLAGSNTTMALLNNGRLLLGTLNDFGALLQLGGAGTTSLATNGIVFATDTSIHRSGAGFIRFGGPQTTGGFDTGSAGYFGITNVSGGGCDIRFMSAGSTELRTNNTLALTLDASQNATFVGDVATANAKAFYWGTRSVMTSPADGVIRLANSAGTDFTRLQFGGTTASFPALSRNGAVLDVVFADGSSLSTLRSASHTVAGVAGTCAAGQVAYGGTTATTVGAAGGASALPATPTGYIIVNVAGTTMKVPYYAN